MPDQDPTPPGVETPTPFDQDAGDVAIELGLHPTRLRDLRREHLVIERDFRFRGNRCFWTREAVEKMRSLLAGDSAAKIDTPAPAPQSSPGVSEDRLAALHAPEPETEPSGPAGVPGRVRKAVVVSRLRDFGGPYRQHFPNPAVIQAAFVDDPQTTVFVRVRHSRNYAPRLRSGEPMVLDVLFNGQRWEAAGRAPRFPGRW